MCVLEPTTTDWTPFAGAAVLIVAIICVTIAKLRSRP